MCHTFTCHAVENPLSFQMEVQPRATDFFVRLLSIFSKAHENELHLIPVHKISLEHKKRIHELIVQYEEMCIKLKGVDSYFEKLPEGEHVYISVDSPNVASPDQSVRIYELLRLLNSGADCDQAQTELEIKMRQYTELFQTLQENYEFIPINPPKRTLYGEADKQKRTCRYCGKSNGTVSFRHVAHAFPESLGNKTIISAEECDGCNSSFASTVDQDAFEYFKIFRALYGKKGKGGIPTLKFKNGEIRHVDGIPCVKFFSEEECFKEGAVSIPLEYIKPLNLMNVYRCLVKFVVGVIKPNELKHFTRTIAWINEPHNTGETLELPKVAMRLDTRDYHDQPSLVIYRRKVDNLNLPYMHAELRLACFIYIFVIPFCSTDQKDFSREENYADFWKANTHYAKLDQWVYETWSIDSAVDFTYRINITQAVQ